MRGHIRKRGAKYSIVFDIGYEDGKRKQKWLSGFNTKKEAEKILAETLTDIDKGTFYAPNKVTLREYLKDWLYNSKKNLTIKTYRSYLETINRYINPNLGDTLLMKLKPRNIQNFYTKCTEELKLSGTTTLYCHRILHKALKMAVQWQMIHTNPTDFVERPQKSKKELIILSKNEVELVLTQLKDKSLYIPILIALTTGMRRGEIAGLKWADIDLEKKIIYVQHQLQKNELGKLELVSTKTSSSNRKIVLLDFTIPILEEYKNKKLKDKLSLGQSCDNNYIICKFDGKPYDPDYITHHFARTMQGLRKKFPQLPKVTFHSLRHTHATLLLKQGIHPKIVAERLGHSQISITLDIYSHVLPDMQQEAAEKLNQLLIG